MKMLILISIVALSCSSVKQTEAILQIHTERLAQLSAQADSLQDMYDTQWFMIEAMYGELEELREQVQAIELQVGMALAIPDQSTYIVKKGDTLWDIAKKLLGTPLRWVEIYQLNTHKIANQDLIYPEQVLIYK